MHFPIGFLWSIHWHHSNVSRWTPKYRILPWHLWECKVELNNGVKIFKGERSQGKLREKKEEVCSPYLVLEL